MGVAEEERLGLTDEEELVNALDVGCMLADEDTNTLASTLR